MSIEPSVLEKVKNLYIFENPENFQSPNLAALCRKYELDYKSVQRTSSEEDWLGQRMEYQEVFRRKKAEGIEHALEIQAIDIGTQITSIIQKSMTVTSEYEKLIDERLFTILNDPDYELTVKELISLKQLMNQRQDSIVKVLLEISKMIQQNAQVSPEQAHDYIVEKFLSKFKENDALVITAHEIQAKLEDKQTSFDNMGETDRKDLFDKLDSKSEE